MNNEPVAWMLMRSEVCVELTEWYGVMRGWEEFLGDNEKIVELYANPVDAVNTSEQYVDKSQNNRHDLTDEEAALRSLYEAIIRYENLSLYPDKYAIESCEYQLHDAKEKARAILRKAQEK